MLTRRVHDTALEIANNVTDSVTYRRTAGLPSKDSSKPAMLSCRVEKNILPAAGGGAEYTSITLRTMTPSAMAMTPTQQPTVRPTCSGEVLVVLTT